MKRHVCVQCGRCCKEHILDIVGRGDVLRWRREGRKDILKHVQLSKNGKYPVSPIWKGVGAMTLGRCPFLRKRGKKYRCAIQDTKPHDCRVYPRFGESCLREELP